MFGNIFSHFRHKSHRKVGLDHRKVIVKKLDQAWLIGSFSLLRKIFEIALQSRLTERMGAFNRLHQPYIRRVLPSEKLHRP